MNKKLLETFVLSDLKNNEIDDINNLPIDVKNKLRDNLVQVLVKKASTDFRVFIELMAPEILPEGFVSGKHIDIICKDLQDIEKSVISTKAAHRASKENKKTIKAKRSQYFLPPRSMKSKLISILFVSWFMGKNPNMDVLQLGHSTKFCIDNFGRGVLDILYSERFKAIFPSPECRVRRSARSAQSFQLEGKGKYYTTGVGSKIAGRGASLLISDDVLSEQEAYNDGQRNKINEWYVGGARSRMQSYGAEIIVNTRWHLEDLSGYLYKLDKGSNNPWNIIKFPAILDTAGADLLGLKEGESYWPELWPIEHFHELRRIMTPSQFNAMYQQNPILEEGNIIKESYWQKWPEDEDEPWCEAILVSLDTAFSEKQRADYSAYTVWGVFFKREIGRNGFEYTAANLFLLGGEKGRWSFPVLCEKILGRYGQVDGKQQLIEQGILQKYNPDYYLIENKASGQSLIQELRLKQLPVIEFDPKRDDKVTRANATASTFISGKVWYPENKMWANEIISEVCSFPAAPHDDFADTVFQAIIWTRKGLIIPSEGELGYEDQMDDQPKVRTKATSYWAAACNQ